MSFSTFSKEFSANMFTLVENQFITKYLPHADGDSVRVYLYGLYLCSCAEEFSASDCAKTLRISEEKLIEYFTFWEECDLVRILSREPLYVQYLPVSNSIGKPKPIRAEKYGDFNRSFYNILQKVKKEFKPYEMQRIFEFLENKAMEPQAFLLVTEYCAKKDGEKLTSAHILNKANKFCDEHKYTFDQVEKELAGFNEREKDVSKIFTLLGIHRAVQEDDYVYLDRWASLGMDMKAVFECARVLKKGSLSSLDTLVTELHEKDAHTLKEAKSYLERREVLADIVFFVARKLGVKVQNPVAFIDEYVEKWCEHGYDKESLLEIATLCFKLRYGFPEMNDFIRSLYASGIVDGDSVKEYCAVQEKRLRVLQRIQSVCGIIKKTQSTLDMVGTWKDWGFTDEMILEAAKRSQNAASPIPYMNKLLSEWYKQGIKSVSDIPSEQPTSATKSDYVQNADKRADRERYYSVLREKAVKKAERAQEKAERNDEFRTACADIRKLEIEVAKAEVFDSNKLPELNAKLQDAHERRKNALFVLSLTEEDLMPHYACKKCSDTGFLPDGRACDCYPN